MSILKRLHQLRAVGFRTGSVEFGCDNPQDEDWVVRYEDWSKIIDNDIEGFYYNQEDYDAMTFRSFFLDYQGTLFNFIIPTKENDYRVMKKATLLMKKVPVKYIQNKMARIRLFETFKSLIEGELDSPVKVNTTPQPTNQFDDDVPF